MKLQFKHQKFQEDAAQAVVDVFAGQPYCTPTYRIDQGREELDNLEFTGWRNEPILPSVEGRILEQLQKVQRDNRIEPSE